MVLTNGDPAKVACDTDFTVFSLEAVETMADVGAGVALPTEASILTRPTPALVDRCGAQEKQASSSEAVDLGPGVV